MDNILKIGHRGAKGHEPENTIISFQKALDSQVDAIELDVHICKTGELVVIHDFTVDRTTDGSGEVHRMSLKEIKALRIDGKYEVPTLEEVFELVGQTCVINVELKGRHTALRVSEIIEKYVNAKGWNYNSFLVSSFQREELEKMSSINPNVALGVLTQASVSQALKWAKEFSAQAIHPHYSLLTPDNVANAQKKGYKVYTWTVNEMEDITRIKSYGVDGIISDYPEKL
ncbi:glycerophosphodiester phosphodiesterase [Flavobacterium sp. '19STA2R22 D10 B1']|uniref:glycerophosphodiester phosphodiesterase n=1 Tax=Flavobacterium aerium TaxID=3037261 RepID=UPI00278C6E03|nr:glycerophosphodiester phosphodiesterase family protein [Flavobacterium sp. '19STA2R22 D10 B1']